MNAPHHAAEHADGDGLLRERLRAAGYGHDVALAQRAAENYAEQFGERAASIALAPGRANLIGEHTDYNGGLVLPFAIDRSVVVASNLTIPSAISERSASGAGSSDRSSFIADDLGQTFSVDLRKPGVLDASFADRPRWMSYVLGAIAGHHRERGSGPANMRMLITSNLPVGAGLSSSAALLVAVLTLLKATDSKTDDASAQPDDHERGSALRLARMCQGVEHDYAGTPCGLMDPLAIAAGRAGHAIRLDCETERFTHVPLPGADALEFLIIDTGVRRSLADGRYGERRRECEAAARALGLPEDRLAHADPSELNAIGDPAARRRAEHVVHEHQRVKIFCRAMQAGDLDEMGRLLFASHDSLRDRFEASFPMADAIVDALRERRKSADDVFGARMIGGGFGGCVLALLRRGATAGTLADRQCKVRRVQDLGVAAFTVKPTRGPAAMPIMP